MTGTNRKITASLTFRGDEMTDVEVINPGDWFGKTWLLGISCGISTDYCVIEADSADAAIDELIDSGKGEALIIDEAQFADYGIGTDNPTCHFAGNNGRPVDLEWLSIHGDDRNSFECLYYVEGWNAPVKPTELSNVLEKLDLRAEYEADVKRPGKMEGNARYIPYFWDAYLDGSADEDIEDEDGYVSRFDITNGDRLLFPELEGITSVFLREDDQGFVHEVDGPSIPETDED